jgi:hypothetical protein
MPQGQTEPMAGRNDLLAAVDFVEDAFQRAAEKRQISPQTAEDLARYYAGVRNQLNQGLPVDLFLRPREVCWSCRASCGNQASCPSCGAPVQGERVDRLRHLICLCFEIRKHGKEGRLPLSVSHAMLADANERVAALRGKLDQDRIPLAQAVEDEEPAAPPSRTGQERESDRPRAEKTAGPQRSLLEILLDPRSIQWLLASGGALLALGLLIYLIAAGVFENKLVIACLLGAGNALLLVGGWSLILGTRYQLAGRALTLLACLLMPFNLWFYQAQGLITLEAGGLWIPALVCCVLYAVSARILEDAIFVPIFVLGVTGTGLLLLADRLLGKFWEISAPATLLVTLGLLCIHAERIFADTDGPFGRKRFGLAFFWSGQVVLAAGLLLVLGGQVFGDWLYPVFKPIYDACRFGQPEIVTEFWGRVLALALVLAGTYAYLYSDLVVRRVGAYLPLAVFTLVWAEVLLIHMVEEWPIPTVEVVIFAFSLTALLVNLAIAAAEDEKTTLFRAGPPLGFLLSTLPVVLGIVLHIRATTSLFPLWNYPLTGGTVAALATTAVVCRIGAYLYRHSRPALSAMYFFGTAAATLTGAASLLALLWRESLWQHQAPVLMVIPILYLVAARLYRGGSSERPLVWVAHTAAVVMLVSSVGASVRGFALPDRDQLNLLLALFFAEAAVFYILAAALHGQSSGVYLATAAGCAAVWQLLQFWGVPDEYYVLTFAVVGLVLLVGYRIAVLDRYSGAAAAAFGCGNAMLSLAFVAGALMTLNELAAAGATQSRLVPLLLSLLGISIVASVLVQDQAWRRWYVVTTFVNAALLVLVLAILTDLTAGQKLELVCVVVGLGMLVSAHVGWYREQERHDDLVSLGMVFGSLLVAVPPAVVVFTRRFGLLVEPGMPVDTFHAVNEAGMLIVGLLLLSTGFVFQLKATTVIGSLTTILYLVTLLFLLRLPAILQTTAVYLMIGGGFFFGLGLLLSIYRAQLLTLPDRVKRREGVFRVLSWR